MILGVSTYIRIWGLDQDPDVASGFANGKVLFVGSACKSICKCKSSFQTDQRVVFFRSSKNPWAKQNADGMYMWHFYGLLATCSHIYIAHIFRGSEASCCNLGDKQKLWLIQASPFFPSRNDLKHTLLLLWPFDALVLSCQTVSTCPKLRIPFLDAFSFGHMSLQQIHVPRIQTTSAALLWCCLLRSASHSDFYFLALWWW